MTQEENKKDEFELVDPERPSLIAEIIAWTMIGIIWFLCFYSLIYIYLTIKT